MMLQRVENVAGLIGTETTPFGHLYSRIRNNFRWPYSFNRMTVRTWRDLARYAGPEAGAEASRRLPWLMEEILENWQTRTHMPNIKFQELVHFGAFDQLEEAARVTAQHLELNQTETEELVQRYRSYPMALSGPGARPLPPLLYGITIGSMDHRPEGYKNVLLPALAALSPPPKVRLVEWRAGVHSYMKPEPDLPQGVGPAIANLWHEAISGGFYLTA